MRKMTGLILPKMFKRRRARKYPVKRDENGKSARQRCFKMLEENVPLPEIADTLDMKIDTVYKYRQQWQKHIDIEKALAFYNLILDKSAPDRERSKEVMASLFGISKEQLEELLQKPYGLRRLLSGKVYFPTKAAAVHRQAIAFELAVLISDHLIKYGGKFEDVYFALDRWMKYNESSREEEDEDIEEENKDIMLLRRIIEADVKMERQGRIRPERLSPQEQEIIAKWGTQSAVKKLEKQAEFLYWFQIGELMTEGITMEQARGKMYQDILKDGHTKEAQSLRAYQNIIHPLKASSNKLGPDSKPQTSL